MTSTDLGGEPEEREKPRKEFNKKKQAKRTHPPRVKWKRDWDETTESHNWEILGDLEI